MSSPKRPYKPPSIRRYAPFHASCPAKLSPMAREVVGQTDARAVELTVAPWDQPLLAEDPKERN
jgi:hypothetical protein